MKNVCFLYREFSTEVLRLLIPGYDDGLFFRPDGILCCGLHVLGMKEYLAMSITSGCCQRSTRPDADYRKQYLVIYDSVPGGTGYLKKDA